MKFLRKLLLFSLLAVGLLAVARVLQHRGTIPKFADTESAGYLKTCRIQPTSGKVWSYSRGGEEPGFAFYRLHLAKEAYLTRGTTPLSANHQSDLPPSPWWWRADANGRTTFSSGGGPGTKRYEIYDPDHELLFVYCEWD